MEISMRQHFIPCLHLKHFIGPNPKGQVWTYDAQTGKVYSATPENTAVQTHFYSAEDPDGTMNTQLEKYLSEIEGKAAPVYEALLRKEIPKNSQARADFSVFLALMCVRTPAMRRIWAEGYGRHLQIMNYAYAKDEKAFHALTRKYEEEQGITLDNETKNLVRESMIDPTDYVFEIPKERTLKALSAADGLSPIFYEMKWSLAVPTHGFFISCDNPLVKYVDPRTCHPIYGDHGFLNKTAEVIFPLSPKLVLLMSWNENILEVGEFTRRNPVDEINRLLAVHSERYLYAHIHHKRLIRLAAKFKDIRPEMTTSGFGPDKFAEIRVLRRWSKGEVHKARRS
jgi:hypothetical protein